MPAKNPSPRPLPSHPDIEFFGSEITHSRHLQVEMCTSGTAASPRMSEKWAFDVVRRGTAVAILLYDPERDSVVLIQQFRLAALLAGCSPWQVEPVGGMVDSGETPTEAAIRETGEERFSSSASRCRSSAICRRRARLTNASTCSAAALIEHRRRPPRSRR
jgi:hypothetical protein